MGIPFCFRIGLLGYNLIPTFIMPRCIVVGMAEESLSEIVEACNELSTDELAQPSLESENAYNDEADFEPNEEQKDAINSILEKTE
jgi:hypothetical protein